MSTESVRLTAESFHPRVSPTGELCPLCQSVLGEGDYSGTVVWLAADDPQWLAESFRPAMGKFFRHWPKVRIQRLTFNGKPIPLSGAQC